MWILRCFIQYHKSKEILDQLKDQQFFLRKTLQIRVSATAHSYKPFMSYLIFNVRRCYFLHYYNLHIKFKRIQNLKLLIQFKSFRNQCWRELSTEIIQSATLNPFKSRCVFCTTHLVYQEAVYEVRGDYVSVFMYLTNLRGIRGRCVSSKTEVFGACTSSLGRQEICQ